MGLLLGPCSSRRGPRCLPQAQGLPKLDVPSWPRWRKPLLLPPGTRASCVRGAWAQEAGRLPSFLESMWGVCFLGCLVLGGPLWLFMPQLNCPPELDAAEAFGYVFSHVYA